MINNSIVMAQTGPPYGDGQFTNEPPAGHGLNITDLFHIVLPKPEDPGINSAVDSQYPNVAIITPDTTNQFGGMWAKDKLDLTMPFSTEMYLHLGHQYGNTTTQQPADGMTFTLHNDSGELNAIGGAGEGLGVYRGRKWTGVAQNTTVHGTYLRNSLVIEFDTYRNRRLEGAYVDDPGLADTSHCALLIPRDNTIYTEDHLNVYYFSPSREWVTFTVDWMPGGNGGGILSYSFDGQPMTYTVENIMATFGGTKVYWGFTGATGQLTSVQAVAITRLPEQGVTAEKTVTNETGENIDQGIAYPGDILTYTIKVTALPLITPVGPVVITDTLSIYTTHVGDRVWVTTKDGSVYEAEYNFSGNIMTISTNHSLLEEGDWLEVLFNVKVKEEAAEQIVSNHAIVNATGLTDPADTNTTEVNILSNPKKEVSSDSAAGVGGNAVKVGDGITYNITYRNDGELPATVIITDRLPDGTDFVSATDYGIYDAGTHTVTWTLTDIPGETGGLVSLVVMVNDKALSKIANDALVQVGDDRPRATNIVENPVFPVKRVSDDSEAGSGGSAVRIGDSVTYDITYGNDGATVADIVIADTLPNGTDFISATGDGIYDTDTRTVTWKIMDVPSGANGTVSLVVMVNETAVVKIENHATVQVGENDPRTTSIVTNTVLPEDPKKKVSDGSEAGNGGSAVKTGDNITYDITYLNHEETAADIIITDSLCDGVDFVSATMGGTYDTGTRTVTFRLTGVPSGFSGTVSLVVNVNENALLTVANHATVQVGENDPQITNTTENPVTPETPVKKVSDSSQAGQGGSMVKVGDRITYEITYRNYGETSTTILITDRLQDGIDFMAATDGGSYNANDHIVTWVLPNVPSGTRGTVSLTVLVNARALVKLENNAMVQVGEHDPQTTNLVENPVASENPKKKVSDSSEAGQGGSAVKAGDKITYDIIYKNYNQTTVSIHILDRLPGGADFVSASEGGIYDATTHTVTWILANVSGGTSGTVSVMVMVNKKAAFKIGNYATIQVGFLDPQFTNYVENPIKGSNCLKTKIPCRKTIVGCKLWKDNKNANATRPPSVEIQLLRNGELYKIASVNATGKGYYSFQCLPINKNIMEKYNYKIEEAMVPNGYTKTIDGCNVINTLNESNHSSPASYNSK